MSSRDNRAVVLPVEGCGPEVDELDPRVPHSSDVPLGGGAVLAVPVVGHEQDVLRLQVRVCQMVIMQELENNKNHEGWAIKVEQLFKKKNEGII